MDVTPITEITGLAIAMRMSEARALQAELVDVLAGHAAPSRHFMADLNRRIEAILGPIEEAPF